MCRRHLERAPGEVVLRSAPETESFRQPMKLLLHEVALPLRHTFTIARGSTSVQPALVVELVEGTDHGYGEASECAYYGASVPAMRTLLESLRADIESLPPAEPSSYWRRWDPLIGQCRFAQAALDAALHDLWGKRLGQPLWRLWGLDRTWGRGATTRSASTRLSG